MATTMTHSVIDHSKDVTAPRQVLIVENDERILHLLESLVSDEGYESRATWSGREALALIQSHPFDAVLVDSHLPDIYCGEFVKRASRFGRSIVVLHTGKPGPTSLRRYKALGASTIVDRGDSNRLRQLLAAMHGPSPRKPH
jgi:CheY-like chemotaxis protein